MRLYDYLHLADFRSYIEAQQRVDALFANPHAWAAAAIRNIAGRGYFSSHRAIREYAEQIWNLRRVPIPNPAVVGE